jgi:protein tyrosine phosphatase (PTP) superfamily phosphohydrolase (DUF442 family)
MSDDPEHITAWQRLSDQVTTSGRLKRKNVAELAALGVRHVINLAPDSSIGALKKEAALMAAENIRYTYIPVPFGAPEEAHFAQFVSAIAASGETTHVHCIANWRVSAFFYRYHRDQCGMPEPAARALMEQQWNPETNLYPGANKWAEFIKPRS